MNHLALGFCCCCLLIQKSCGGWGGGMCPVLLRTDPEWKHQEWHSAGVKIKVRPQNFERTLQILWTFAALSNGLLDFDIYEDLLISPRIQIQTYSSKKVQWYCYIVARVNLHAHQAFQAPITSSELEIVLSELWLHIFFFIYCFI